MWKQVFFGILVGTIAWAQTASPPNQPPASAQAAVATGSNPAGQMELDLDQMESLLSNMATEVSFISDTNMQILLSTNVRLWTLLLRDLRLQLAQQRHHGQAGPSQPAPDSRKPK